MSAAAGVYAASLLEDADINTDLTIVPGQNVTISGDPSLPQWGMGLDDTCQYANDGVCDDGSDGDSGGGGSGDGSNSCPAHSHRDPDDTTSCSCDLGYAVNAAQTACSVCTDGYVVNADRSACVPAGGPACPLGTDSTDCGSSTDAGGFTVQARASLALAFVAMVGGNIRVLPGGSLTLRGCMLSGSSTISVESGTLTVQASTLSSSIIIAISDGGTASLSSSNVSGSSLRVTDGSLNLASMAVPIAVLRSAQSQLRGVGSTIQLSAVTVTEAPDDSELTGTMVVQADGISKTTDPPGLADQLPAYFSVRSGRRCTSSMSNSDVTCRKNCCHDPLPGVDPSVCTDIGGMDAFGGGGHMCPCRDGNPGNAFTCTAYDNNPPCTLSEGCRCVGRPGGYGRDEECTIDVGWGGVLDKCGAFEMSPTDQWGQRDFITLPDGSTHGGSDCPVGAVLAPGSVAWVSDHDTQGGEWQICFV